MKEYISKCWCKKDVIPLLTHWSYVFLALSHQYAVQMCKQKGRNEEPNMQQFQIVLILVDDHVFGFQILDCFSTYGWAGSEIKTKQKEKNRRYICIFSQRLGMVWDNINTAYTCNFSPWLRTCWGRYGEPAMVMLYNQYLTMFSCLILTIWRSCVAGDACHKKYDCDSKNLRVISKMKNTIWRYISCKDSLPLKHIHFVPITASILLGISSDPSSCHMSLPKLTSQSFHRQYFDGFSLHGPEPLHADSAELERYTLFITRGTLQLAPTDTSACLKITIPVEYASELAVSVKHGTTDSEF